MTGDMSISDQWSELMADPDLDRIRPMLVVASREPRLRRILPVVSHLTELRLIPHVDDRSEGQIWITLSSDGSYRVAWTGPESFEQHCSSPAEAVAAALDIAASNIG